MRFPRIAVPAVALLCCAASAAMAQDVKAVSIGAQGGAAFSKPGGSDADEINSTFTSFHVGAFARAGLSRNFAVQPELNFIRKGAKFTGGGNDLTIRLSYVQLPVLLMGRFPQAGNVSPHVYAGPAVAARMGCSGKVSSGSQSVSSSCDAADIQTKSTDASVIVGGGIDIGHAIIDIRYDYGLTKIDGSDDPNDVKHRTFSILAGWKFRTTH